MYRFNSFSLENIKQKVHLTEKRSEIPVGYTCAAVMILLVGYEENLSILLTKRTKTVRDHQNQISFPGGVCEKEDKSLLDTALREAWEEIGVQIPVKHIIGSLKPRKTVTGYFIAPYIAYLENYPEIKPNPKEVVKVLNAPLNWLADKQNYCVKPYKRDCYEIHDVVFYRPCDNEIIWGITAQIILDFLDEIKK